MTDPKVGGLYVCTEDIRMNDRDRTVVQRNELVRVMLLHFGGAGQWPSHALVVGDLPRECNDRGERIEFPASYPVHLYWSRVERLRNPGRPGEEVS